MKIKNSVIIPLTVLFFVGLCLTVTTSWASERNAQRRAAMSEEIGRPQPTVQVSIKTKIRGAVITNIGDNYMISNETIVVGIDGKQVKFRKMLVPCEAEIAYEVKNGTRKANRITIKRIDENASFYWGIGTPE